jgi:serine/threonine protein kinase/DNA-binding beta-propeller fold protein YncE
MTSSCLRCGSSYSSAALEGLCPNCVGRLILDPEDLAAKGFSGPVRTRVRYFGDYELIEEVARGGMGVVYKARQLSLNRVVAIKMILAGQLASETDVLRFRAEAEAAAGLRHPNIVAIHEIGEQDGQQYFSMDYVDGRNLADLGKDRGITSVESFRETARYLKTIAEAIHYAHERGILHRDLKPSNILIDESDQPHITDFGLAKRVKHDSDLTQTGQVLGTPNFMPPEQASTQRGSIGPHSDVYSLGAILYFLLTGKPPFAGETVHETLSKVLDGNPAEPRTLNSAIPLDLDTICLKCLEKEPQRRYSSARELAMELNRFLEEEPIHARPLGHLEKGWRWCKRRPTAVGLGLALILSLWAAMATWRSLRSANASYIDPGPPRPAERPSNLYTGAVPIVIALDGDNLNSRTVIGPGNGIAIDPANNRLWCPVMTNGSVVVCDGITGAVLTNLYLADCPGSAVIDPIKRVVWIAAQCGMRKGLQSSDRLWAIDADTYAVKESISTGGINGSPEIVNPLTGIYYHGLGRHTKDGILGSCQRIDLSNLPPTGTSFGLVRGIDPAANLLYAFDKIPGGGSKLQILDGAQDPERVLTSVELPFVVGEQIAVDPALNRVYVPNSYTNIIAVLDGKTGHELEVILVGTAKCQIREVACDSARNRLFAIGSPTPASAGSAWYLYSIQGTNQQEVALGGGVTGLVVNPVLNRVYIWSSPTEKTASH